MENENRLALKIMALGRPFRLGMAYDWRSDTLRANIPLWSNQSISNSTHRQSCMSTSFEIHTKDTLMTMADLLGMDTNMTISALAGLVELAGSAEVFNYRKTTEHTRLFIVKYSLTTRREKLSLSNLDKLSTIRDATHVVTDILYGAEVYFVFDRTLSQGEDQEKVDQAVLKLLGRMASLRASLNGQLDWKEDEKSIGRLLRCNYFGDFSLSYRPRTFEEAVILFQRLPKLMGENQEHSVPKQIWIYPLLVLTRPLRAINTALVNRSLTLFERLNELRMTVNDLTNSVPPSILIHCCGQQLLTFCHRLNQFEIYLREQMKDLLPKIRAHLLDENALDDLLKKHDLWTTKKNMFDQWIQFRKEELRILIAFFHDLASRASVHVSNSSSFQAQYHQTGRMVLYLIIHVVEKRDPFIDEIFQFPNRGNPKINSWFDRDNLESVRKKIALFCEFADRNRNSTKVAFVAAEKYADEFQMKRNVSTILYRDGIRLNFETPSEPGKPQAIRIAFPNVTLRWSKPTYGSGSIQQYKIFARIISTAEWQLVTTTADATPTAVMTNLRKGKYKFKLQGITLAGDTAESTESEIIDTEAALDLVLVPRPTMTTPAPTVTAQEITTEKTILDVTPAWFEPVKSIRPDHVRLPLNYNKDVPKDVRTFECLSTYRAMVEKTEHVDFVTKPFIPAVQNTETLVVVLNELAHQLGARLTFTNSKFNYDDSDYRTACGVTNLGSIHSFLATEGSFQTAKFDLHLKLDYDQITASPETLRNFVLSSINDISTVAQCNKEFVRVFAVSRVSSILIGFGITAPQPGETKKVAESLKQKLNRPATIKRSDLLQYLFPEQYDYKLEPALSFLQLQQSDFDPRFNRVYPDAQEERRGGFPYHFPQGWYRHALKVVDKYSQDKLWLGMDNRPGEWAVAYHGTRSGGVRTIADKGLTHDSVLRDALKEQAKQQNPSIPDVQGLYVATHCEGGASNYTTPFTVTDPNGISKSYRVAFQCRVQPRKFTVHEAAVKIGKAWRVFDEKAIRPYGLLLKSD